MKHFTGVNDAGNIEDLVKEALALKQQPFSASALGKHRTLGLVFLNPSLRTRLSTQKAATNLGMNVMVMNIGQESWAWEFEEGAVMNGNKVEHIKDAAAVIGQYCDVVAIRCFPSLLSQEEDYTDRLLKQFINYCRVPVISLESATRHPLQSFADLLTIRENWTAAARPKVVLTWAPHIKPLPQVVANSFCEWMTRADVDLTITHPQGYELSPEFTGRASLVYDQQEALKDADFVYVKNWSAFHDYGKILPGDHSHWMLSPEKLKDSRSAKIMHCLPVRRNVELSDQLLDGEGSLVLEQANNRVYAAQAVLKKILETNFN